MIPCLACAGARGGVSLSSLRPRGKHGKHDQIRCASAHGHASFGTAVLPRFIKLIHLQNRKILSRGGRNLLSPCLPRARRWSWHLVHDFLFDRPKRPLQYFQQLHCCPATRRAPHARTIFCSRYRTPTQACHEPPTRTAALRANASLLEGRTASSRQPTTASRTKRRVPWPSLS